MNEQQLKPGEVVRLKSGGPVMTIETLFESAGGQIVAQCQWFDEKKPFREKFPLSSLEKAD